MMKSGIRNMVRLYLNYLDQKPITTMILGVIGSYMGLFALFVALGALEEIFGDLGYFVAIILIVPVIFLAVFGWMVLTITCEAVWSVIGIYALLGVRGRPLRNGWDKFVKGVENGSAQ